jgi:virginiamycin A acetyltransferase
MDLDIIRRLVEKIKIRLLMRNEMESASLRQHFLDRHELDVGLYSYGCFDRVRFPPRTRIGRYCSMARTARVIDANHPVGALTTHPYLYESRWGVISHDIIDPPWLVIEDDVWLGQNAVIMPGCKFIGRGAIIGAGAVVTRDVPAYGIMTGVPASLKRLRFPPHVIEALEDSRWWELSRTELAQMVRNHESSFVNLAAAGPEELAALLPVRVSDAGRIR